jgi:hypothetical protein
MWLAAEAAIELPPEASPGPERINYIAIWVEPGGPWVFTALADTAEGRRQLVHAFITAAGR